MCIHFSTHNPFYTVLVQVRLTEEAKTFRVIQFSLEHLLAIKTKGLANPSVVLSEVMFLYVYIFVSHSLYSILTLLSFIRL